MYSSTKELQLLILQMTFGQKFSELPSHPKKTTSEKHLCLILHKRKNIRCLGCATSNLPLAPFLRTSSKRTLNLTAHSFRASTTFDNMNKLYRLHGKSYQHDQGLKFKSFSSQCQETAQRKGKLVDMCIINISSFANH